MSDQIERAISTLRDRGVGAWTAAPPAFRILWRLGFAVRPPHFMPFASLASSAGAGFGVFMLPIILWSTLSQPTALGAANSVILAVILSLTSGAAFGLSMASYYRWSARRLGLPSWELLLNR